MSIFTTDKPHLSTAVSFFTAPDGLLHEILGPSEKRRSVTFLNANAAPGYAITPGGQPTLTASYVVNGTLIPFTWYYEIHGDVVQRPWFATPGAVGQVLVIIECLEN